VRDRVESVAHGGGEAREGLLVTALRPSDQLGIHDRFRRFGTRDIRGLTHYGCRNGLSDSI
jgi:hypothetical protein